MTSAEWACKVRQFHPIDHYPASIVSILVRTYFADIGGAFFVMAFFFAAAARAESVDASGWLRYLSLARRAIDDVGCGAEGFERFVLDAIAADACSDCGESDANCDCEPELAEEPAPNLAPS